MLMETNHEGRAVESTPELAKEVSEESKRIAKELIFAISPVMERNFCGKEQALDTYVNSLKLAVAYELSKPLEQLSDDLKPHAVMRIADAFGMNLALRLLTIQINDEMEKIMNERDIKGNTGFKIPKAEDLR